MLETISTTHCIEYELALLALCLGGGNGESPPPNSAIVRQGVRTVTVYCSEEAKNM